MTREKVFRDFGIFLLFFLVSCLFSYRAFLDGLMIAPDNDAMLYSYPLKHLYSYALKQFELPLWNPYEFAGLSFLGTMSSGLLYPLNLVTYFSLPAPYAYNFNYLFHFALGGFFTFLYVRLLGVRGIPAFLAGIAFGYSGFVLATRDHPPVQSAVYLPLLVYLFEKLLRNPRLRNSLLIALVVAVQFLAGGLQMCVYTYIVLGLFLIFHVRHAGQGRRAAFFFYGALGPLIGFLIAAPQALALWEAADFSYLQSVRTFAGYEYFSRYHLHLTMLPSFIFPRLFDGWGPEESMQTMFCVLPLVVAAVTALGVGGSGRRIMFWSAVAATGFILSLGSDTPLHRLLYHVPVYNSFRAHGRNLFEFHFAVSVLFSAGIDAVLYGGEKGGRLALRSAYVLLFILLASLVVFLAIPRIDIGGAVRFLGSKGFVNPARLKELSLTMPEVYMPMIFMAAYLVTLIIRGRRIFIYLLTAILLLEAFYTWGLGAVSGPKLSEANNLCASQPYGGFVGDPYRFANISKSGGMFFNNLANMTCRMSSATGYEVLAPAKYISLLNLWHAGMYSDKWELNLDNNIIIGMLGVKYLNVAKDYGLKDIEARKTALNKPLLESVPVGNFTGMNASPSGEGRYVLHAMEGAEGGVYGALELREGTYLISLKARAPEGADRTLSAALSTPSYYRNILQVFPDFIGKDFQSFHQVFRVARKDRFYLAVTTPSTRLVEVGDIKVERFKNYAPPPLNAGDSSPEGVYEKLFESKNFEVYLNRNHLPRAWSVYSLIPVGDFNEVKRKLDLLEINPAEEAMLYEADLGKIGRGRFAKGTVSVEKYGMNEVSVKADFPATGFMVLADQYYPGWKAYIDGNETEIYETNGILRGVVVPAGEHAVIFKYRPAMIIFLLASSLLLTAVIAAYLILERRKKPEI